MSKRENRHLSAHIHKHIQPLAKPNTCTTTDITLTHTTSKAYLYATHRKVTQ